VASPFEVLGIDPGSDREEIKTAYKRRIKQAHPDHGGSAAEFQRVRAAYERLKNGYGEGDGDAAERVAGGRRDRTPGGESGAAASPPEREAEPTEAGATEADVEYLNYEVLDDYGWTIEDADLFEKAADTDLDPVDYGRFSAEPGDTLLEAAEGQGFAWPYACRGGACANCAVAVLDGDLSMPVDHILPTGMTDRGIRLSCMGKPIAGDMQVVYNLKHMPELDELRLPPRPFERAHSGD
jgi:curved DNA-binding protein CbpA